MKKLYLIGGTMGVGKTTVSRILADMLPNCVFLDGDWCWDAHPFVVNDETKQMVMENICFMLGNFMRCRTYENVVFCWVMDMQDTIDAILSSLPWDDYEIVNISLVCDGRELKKGSIMMSTAVFVRNRSSEGALTSWPFTKHLIQQNLM